MAMPRVVSKGSLVGERSEQEQVASSTTRSIILGIAANEVNTCHQSQQAVY